MIEVRDLSVFKKVLQDKRVLDSVNLACIDDLDILYEVEGAVFLCADDRGGFIYLPSGPNVYEVHTLYPIGYGYKKAKAHAKQSLDYIFKVYDALIVYSYANPENRVAIRLMEDVGMQLFDPGYPSDRVHMKIDLDTWLSTCYTRTSS